MSHTIQTILQERYGYGRFLTNASLSWNDAYAFEVTASYSSDLAEAFHAANTLEVDGVLCEEKMDIGEGCVPLWQDEYMPLFADVCYSGIYTVASVIKKPGESVFKVPTQLAPVIPCLKMQANHHFQLSPYALDKYCMISVRYLPALESGFQVGIGWHAHKPYTYKNCYEAFKPYELSQETIDAMKDISPYLLHAEYYRSSWAGTLLQSTPFSAPVKTRQSQDSIDIISETPPYLQAGSGQTVLGNNYVYHSAGKTPKTCQGYYRMFMLVSFLAPRFLEDRFPIKENAALQLRH